MKGIVIGLLLYVAFVIIIVAATVRALIKLAPSGEVGIDLVTLYHNTFEHNLWLVIALVGCILVGNAV